MISGESQESAIEARGLLPNEGRSWLLLAVFVAVLVLGALIPVSALVRGVLRFGAQSVAAGQSVSRPLIDLAGPVQIQGASSEPVVAIGGRITVRGHVGDDVVAIGSDVLLSSTAHVDGNVVSLGGRIYQARGAVVAASIIGNRTPWSLARLAPPGPSLSYFIGRLRLAGLAITALLLLGLAVWAVLPWPAIVTTATARRWRLRSAALGIGALLWTPLILAPLAVSLAGLPLAVLLSLGFGLLWLLGLVSSAVRLGHRLLSIGGGPHSLLSSALAGLMLLGLLSALPVVGSLTLLFAGCIGLGAALLAVWDRESASDFAVTQTLAALTFPD